MDLSAAHAKKDRGRINHRCYIAGATSYDVLIEKLLGIPIDVQMCRVLFISGSSAAATTFYPVNANGTVDINQSLSYVSSMDKSFQSWNETKDCMFKIQARVWKQGLCTTKTIGQCTMDMEKYIESGKGEHIFCLPEESSSFRSTMLPYIQITLNPPHFESADTLTLAPNEDPEDIDPIASPASWQGHSKGKEVTIKSLTKHGGSTEAEHLKNNERRAHYAENWSKVNFPPAETNDLADKRISMETETSYAELQSQKNPPDSPRGYISASSSEDGGTSSKMSEHSDELLNPAVENGARAAVESLDRHHKPALSRLEELETENRVLKATVDRLENDLSKSKAETQSANVRVKTLVDELVSMKKKVDESSRHGRDKPDPVSRKCSFHEGGLLRQTSTTSEYLETVSKRSIASHRSSNKSVIGRTTSVLFPIKPEKTSTQRSMNAPVTEEIETHKLAFAEQLVQKEETIHELERQVDFTMSQIRQLEAGIDGVETRFAHELDVIKLETSKKYQSLLEAAQDFLKSSKKSDKKAAELKREMQKLSSMISHDVKLLEQNVRKKDEHRTRLAEEKRILRRKFDAKIKEREDAEKQICEMRDEIDRQKLQNNGMRNDIRHLEDKIAFLNSRLADLTVEGVAASDAEALAEIQTLNNRISSLESGLAEYESKNRSLIEQLDNAHAKLDEVAAHDEMDMSEKENRELRQEISDVSEKLVDLEQENNSLREELDGMHNALNQVTELEEKVQGLQTTNQEVEGQLTRKKKHIDMLQSELKELRLKIHNHQTDHGFDSRVSQENLSSHVDGMLQAEQRYEELEKSLAAVQAERNELIGEKVSKNKMLHSLIKENKTLSGSLKKAQKQSSKLTDKLEEAKAEIATLQGSFVSHSCSSRHSSKGRHIEDGEEQIMTELVNAKVSLAENDERLIKLRRDLHKSLARNMVISAKASRLETHLRELKQERGGFIRRKTTKTHRFT